MEVSQRTEIRNVSIRAVSLNKDDETHISFRIRRANLSTTNKVFLNNLVLKSTL